MFVLHFKTIKMLIFGVCFILYYLKFCNFTESLDNSSIEKNFAGDVKTFSYFQPFGKPLAILFRNRDLLYLYKLQNIC